MTIKVPCQSVRYPHWKFDIERMATHPFLLDGLCAKHKQIARKIFMSNDFKQEMTSVIGEGEICLAQEVLSPQIALLNKNGKYAQMWKVQAGAYIEV